MPGTSAPAARDRPRPRPGPARGRDRRAGTAAGAGARRAGDPARILPREPRVALGRRLRDAARGSGGRRGPGAVRPVARPVLRTGGRPPEAAPARRRGGQTGDWRRASPTRPTGGRSGPTPTFSSVGTPRPAARTSGSSPRPARGTTSRGSRTSSRSSATRNGPTRSSPRPPTRSPRRSSAPMRGSRRTGASCTSATAGSTRPRGTTSARRLRTRATGSSRSTSRASGPRRAASTRRSSSPRTSQPGSRGPSWRRPPATSCGGPGGPTRRGPGTMRALAGYLESASLGEVQYHHHLAEYYADVEGDGAAAVLWAERDHELRPHYATEAALAWALHRAGRHDEALEAAHRTLASGVQRPARSREDHRDPGLGATPMAEQSLSAASGSRTLEARLAVVCYGGVSLAIYMSGITREIQELVTGSADAPGGRRRRRERPACTRTCSTRSNRPRATEATRTGSRSAWTSSPARPPAGSTASASRARSTGTTRRRRSGTSGSRRATSGSCSTRRCGSSSRPCERSPAGCAGSRLRSTSCSGRRRPQNRGGPATAPSRGSGGSARSCACGSRSRHS